MLMHSMVHTAMELSPTQLDMLAMPDTHMPMVPTHTTMDMLDTHMPMLHMLLPQLPPELPRSAHPLP